jgi:hypothetical protein
MQNCDMNGPTYPVTINQENLLMAEALIEIQTGKEPAPFHMITGFQVAGPLDLSILDKTLNYIVERHAGLRAAYFAVRGDDGFKTTYKQKILAHAPISLRITSIESLSASDREPTIRSICAQEYEPRFDYSRPPLIRAHVVKLDRSTHLLIVVVHHMVFDLWSHRLFAKELARVYEANINGSPIDIQPLRAHYPDFAVWQHQQLKSGAFRDPLNYWQSRLPLLKHGMPELGDFPEFVQGSRSDSTGVGEEWITIEDQVTAAVDALARKSRVTRHVLLLAAFFVVIHKFTKKTSLTLCGNFANRGAPEMAHFIGWTTNTHLMNVELSGEMSFEDLVGRVRETVYGAKQHEQLPLTTILQNIALSAATKMLIFFDTWSETAPITFSGGTTMTAVNLPVSVMEEWGSCLFVTVCGGAALRVCARYSLAKLTSSGVMQMAEHLRRVIVACSNTPCATVCELSRC